jgi:hypothetical protein
VNMTRTINTPELHASYIVEGEHVYAPPDSEILMNDPRAEFYERPMGFYSEDLRHRYIDSSARIAGVGGGGATLAVMLAKEGVSDFSIADIDVVDATNVGRIPVFAPCDIGRQKVDVVADLITRFNPTATVRVYEDGVTENNLEEFLGYKSKNSGMTIGVNEIEITEPLIGRQFHVVARKLGIYTLTATDVERGGMVTVYDPFDMKHTYEHSTGAKPTDSDDVYVKKVKGFQLPSIANVPKNGSIKTLLSTQKKDVPLPTTLRSVLNATDLALDEYEKLLTIDNRLYDKPHFYPQVHCVNPSQGEDFTTRFSRTRSVTRIAQMCIRDLLKRNPPASYDDLSRKARENYRNSYSSN